MILPFCVVGHVISSSRQFSKTKLSLLNKLQRMICSRLLITNPTSTRDIISSSVRLVDVFLGQIVGATSLLMTWFNLVSPTQQFMLLA